MPTREYWKNRFDALQESILNRADNVFEESAKAYERAIRDLEKEISYWYQRFADINDINLQDAKKLLSSNELKAFKLTVDEYIEIAQRENLSPEWIKLLDNASVKVRVSRLEVMQIEFRQKIEELSKMRELDLQELLPDLYSEKYYKTIYEIQQGYNLGRTFAKLDDTLLDTLISKPWASDGLDFSDRIWRDRDQLVGILNTEFKQSLIRGEAPDRLIKLVSERMGTAKNKAGRLIMTESSYISSVSQKRAFKEMDVDEYEYVATLDLDTSDQCRSADKWDPLPMSDYEIGVTAPPLHPYCRSTTVPYFPDNYTERFARGADGETYTVEDMDYEEWFDRYVAV